MGFPMVYHGWAFLFWSPILHSSRLVWEMPFIAVLQHRWSERRIGRAQQHHPEDGKRLPVLGRLGSNDTGRADHDDGTPRDAEDEPEIRPKWPPR